MQDDEKLQQFLGKHFGGQVVLGALKKRSVSGWTWIGRLGYQETVTWFILMLPVEVSRSLLFFSTISPNRVLP